MTAYAVLPFVFTPALLLGFAALALFAALLALAASFDIRRVEKIAGTIKDALTRDRLAGVMLGLKRVRAGAIALVFALVAVEGIAYATVIWKGNGRGGPVDTRQTCSNPLRGYPRALYTSTNGSTTDKMQYCLQSSNNGLVWATSPYPAGF